jgi:hypothetical protein
MLWSQFQLLLPIFSAEKMVFFSKNQRYD